MSNEKTPAQTSASPNPVMDLSWLLLEVGNAFVQTLESMGTPGLTAGSSEEAAAIPGLDSALWWHQELSLAPGATIWTGATQDAWKAIGSRSLESLGISEAAEPEVQDTWREILAQSFAGLAARLSAVCAREVTCGPGALAPAPPPKGQRAFITLHGGDDFSVRLCVTVAPELLETLAAITAAARKHSEESAPPRRLSAYEKVQRFPTLLELEMPVALSFGRIKISLDEALKLEKGSLIPLRKMASAQGELKMNNRCIARGRISEVDGYYALTIEELVRRRGRGNGPAPGTAAPAAPAAK